MAYNSDSTPGYTFTRDDAALTIPAGELYGSKLGYGIDSGRHSGITLNNNGNILGAGGVGLFFSGGDNYHIVNNANASIIGLGGVFSDSTNGVIATISNLGSIMGLSDAGIGAGNVAITNRGYIYGHTDGVNFGPGTNTIDNFGLIRADGFGINTQFKTDETAIITNEAGGVISGAIASIHSPFSSPSGIRLVNAGTLQGEVLLEASDEIDVIINRVGGVIRGDVLLGTGDDTYNALGGGKVIGTISGQAGVDTFVAGRARELFNGGADTDTFVYRAAAFSPVGANHDIISGFVATGVGHDHIDVHLMDADLTHAGRQHFAFIGTDTFAHYRSLHPAVIGMLRFDAASHTLQGNVNGNFSNAEFVVGLPGVSALGGGDLDLA